MHQLRRFRGIDGVWRIHPDYNLGNGGDWATTAKHVTVNTTPTVGSVAEWNDNDYDMGSDGHVGIVEQVGPDDSYIWVSQQNIGSDTDGHYDWEKIDAGEPAKTWEPWPETTSFILRTSHRCLLLLLASPPPA